MDIWKEKVSIAESSADQAVPPLEARGEVTPICIGTGCAIFGVLF